MDKWLPYLVPAVCSFIVGYLLSYRNHGLTVRREAANRRREFRAAVRLVAMRFDDVNSTNFCRIYQESISEIKKLCAGISDDIGLWKKARFVRCRDSYCGFKQSDLELPRPKTPAETGEYMKANAKKREESKAMLLDLLKKLATCAA